MRFFASLSIIALLGSTGLAAITKAPSHGVAGKFDSLTKAAEKILKVAETINAKNFEKKVPEIITDIEKLFKNVTADITTSGSGLGNSPVGNSPIGSSPITKRQACENVEDVIGCLEQLGEIITDPTEILGGSGAAGPGGAAGLKTRNDGPAARRATAPKPPSGQVQKAICSAFEDFMMATEKLFKTLSMKTKMAGSSSPLTAAIATALHAAEAVIEQVVQEIIAAVPDCKANATQAQSAVDQALQGGMAKL